MILSPSVGFSELAEANATGGVLTISIGISMKSVELSLSETWKIIDSGEFVASGHECIKTFELTSQSFLAAPSSSVSIEGLRS